MDRDNFERLRLEVRESLTMADVSAADATKAGLVATIQFAVGEGVDIGELLLELGGQDDE